MTSFGSSSYVTASAKSASRRSMLGPLLASAEAPSCATTPVGGKPRNSPVAASPVASRKSRRSMAHLRRAIADRGQAVSSRHRFHRNAPSQPPLHNFFRLQVRRLRGVEAELRQDLVGMLAQG